MASWLRMRLARWMQWCAVAAALACTLSARSGALTQQPTLYLVGYAHLDTQWRWEYPTVITEYLPKTLFQNFALFEEYPDYIFNFTGANRYELIKEYFPADFIKLKEYVAAGRWFPGGSNVEECDLDVPSVESLWRQILYGNDFFQREFGKTGSDFMDPDAFGYPASLPSVLAHAGLKGFSTQKLGARWGSAAGIPFNLGVWVGPDGRGIVAALNPGSYASTVTEDLSENADLLRRVQDDGQRSGVFADYQYYGTGDTGGSPTPGSVQEVERSVHGTGPLHIVSADSDQIFLDLGSDAASHLPHYQGDLLLTQHSAGSLSSQAYIKRWNNDNEVLADAAERASVAADWLGGLNYPLERLNRAWRLVLGAQFHDIIAGTATPTAYEYSWNDEVIALNQFAGVVSGAVQSVASGLDTRTQGAALVVFNPLAISREDVVEARLSFGDGVPAAVRVVGPDGKDVPAQLEQVEAGTATVLFVARVPAVGFAVYDVQAAGASAANRPAAKALKVDRSSLENARYRVRVDANGDIASIFDKRRARELLTGPARLAFQSERPQKWPAWNMDWADQRLPPRSFVQGSAKVEVVERGAARVALQITRDSEGSRFVQTIRLAAGDAGNRLEIANTIDWKSSQAALKATFPLAVHNANATYNLGLGAIERGTNDEKKYEVPSHQWFDLTDRDASYGVTILSGAKYGSDKPDDHTLRLTLIYTPGASTMPDQATQDWGHHEFVYGLAGHIGDWRREQTGWQALRLNSPLLVFTGEHHPGGLGKAFSFVSVDNHRVNILALKRAEHSDELILRLVEMAGKSQPGVRVRFASSIVAAREIDAQERPVGSATVTAGVLVSQMTAYQPRSFALRLAAAKVRTTAPISLPLTLDYDRAVATMDGAQSSGGFDATGAALPAQMLPAEISYQGVRFELAPSAGRNALSSRGQSLALPVCDCNHLYILAAAEGDQLAEFRVGEHSVHLLIQDWSGFVGQWDDRIWKPAEKPAEDTAPTPSSSAMPESVFAGLQPGFIKRSPIAWFASHRHAADGSNLPYAYGYLFAYTLDLPAGARTLTLPDNDKIKILAVSAVQDVALTPARTLYGGSE